MLKSRHPGQVVLHDAVNSGLEQKWSPKQISKRLRQDFPDDDGSVALCTSIRGTRHVPPGNGIRYPDSEDSGCSSDSPVFMCFEAARTAARASVLRARSAHPHVQ